MDKKQDKEYLDQIWGEIPDKVKFIFLKRCGVYPNDIGHMEQGWKDTKTSEKKKIIQRSIGSIIDLIKLEIDKAVLLPDTADHKSERIKRLTMLLNYLRGE